jgi:Transglycosylase SLT domain
VVVAAAASTARAETIADVAAELGVDAVDLAGAVNTTGYDPRTYLCLVNEGPCPKPAVVASTPLERRADCIIFRESRGYAGAVNPRSGASGLGQFLPSTWRTTPQGRAGYSVFDPVANRAAVVWMLQVGRGREFSTIGGC